MTSLLCDFGLRGKRNKRFKGERERERERERVPQNRVWAREEVFLFFKGNVDTSFFKSHGQMLKCLIASHLETLNLEIWNYQPP